MGVTFRTSHTAKTKRKRSLSPGAGARCAVPRTPEVPRGSGVPCTPTARAEHLLPSRSFWRKWFIREYPFSCVCVSLLYNLHNYRARAVASTVHYGLNNARMEHPTSRSQMRDKAERGTSRPLSPPRASVECLARSAPTDGPDPYTSSCHLSERGREHL